MLVGTHDRAVDHRVFVVGIGRQHLEEPLPDAAFGPPGEARMNLDRIAKALGQIPPWNACPITIEHRFDKQPIVLGRHSHVTLASRQDILDLVPLVVPKGIAAHPSAPNQLTSHESRKSPLGNHLIEDRP